jgi:hypothetical protein
VALHLNQPRTFRLGVWTIAFALSLAACSHQNQGHTGTATLIWTRVTKNSDGTNLTDLAGYQIWYGKSPKALNNVVTLSNPNLTTYQVTNLSPGTWYFAVAAYRSNGKQGWRSAVASKTVK